MINYRRSFVPGGSFFFTVNLADRRQRLLTEHIDELRSAFRRCVVTTEAIVVLPDHLHALWTLPEGDADFAMRWRQIKPAFSRSLPTGELVSGSRGAKGERGIWQRRYREHTLMVGTLRPVHPPILHKTQKRRPGLGAALIR